MRADGRYRRRLTRARGWEADPAWSPDARRIVFSSERTGNYELYVMNADGTGQRRLTFTADDDEYGAAWSPDGTRIAFWRRGHGSDAIVVVTLADRSERTISPLPADDNFPAWSPDGTRIAFVNDSEAEIWVMQADGSNRRRLITGPFTEPAELDWAPAR